MNNSIDKLFLHLAFIVISFFGTWFLLSQIEFIAPETAERFSKEREAKLGEMILKSIKSTSEEIESEDIKAVLDTLAKKICEGGNLDCGNLKIHLIRSSEINAFALPDHHMVIYTGLIDYAQNAEELTGVMAHEIGHMEKNHVMKKLSKEIGLAMLFTLAGGNGGMEILKETTRVLTSSAFDRHQETEADMYAVELMANADVDPEHLANILFRLSRAVDMPEELAWISSHPESKERAAEILNKKKEYTFESRAILDTPWSDVQKMLFDNQVGENTSEGY